MTGDLEIGVLMFRVAIPMLPPRECSPNARVHWSAKHKATKSFRTAAMVCALEASRFSHPELSRAEVSITLVVGDARYYRDPDNMVASLKSAIDGCIDAGIIEDDSDEHLRYRMPIIYKIDRDFAPMTILEFNQLQEHKKGERSDG